MAARKSSSRKKTAKASAARRSAASRGRAAGGRKAAAKRASSNRSTAKKSAKKAANSSAKKAVKRAAQSNGHDKTLGDLFLDTLKDVYYAENKILKTLPKMAKAASSQELSEAFLHHRDQTKGQVERLERIFGLLHKPARGKTCDAIEGIIDEGSEIMDEYKNSEALDAGLLAAAQAVEHYEISRYGTLKAWAKRLGMNEAADLLEETLAEEKDTDKTLTSLALSGVNDESLIPRKPYIWAA